VFIEYHKASTFKDLKFREMENVSQVLSISKTVCSTSESFVEVVNLVDFC